MRKAFAKIIILILFTGLNWAGLLTIGQTLANFSDVEISEGNTFSAGTLVFSLHSGQSNFVPESKSENMEPGDEVNRVIQVRNEGLLVFQYTAWTEKISGDGDFCDVLQLKAVLEGKEKYNGSLMGFNFPAIEMIDPPGIDTWHFKAWLPEGANFENKTCQIKFVFDGWQTNFPDSSSGFFDREEIESYFADWVDSASNQEESIEQPILVETLEENITEQDENVEQQEEQPVAEEPVVEEPATVEQPASSETTNGTTENSQNENQVNEEISSEPATTPDETQIQLPADSSENSQASNPETNNSSGYSSQENSTPNVDTITAPNPEN